MGGLIAGGTMKRMLLLLAGLIAGSPIADVLSNLVQASGDQVGGYIILRSSSSFCAQELFGTQSLSLLSAVPAVPLN